ncbi:ATP-dependent protease ATPase subunit HslU [Anaerosalibacter bizertensis]|uniref:ATP-dependent protease ATPase subunit HslU n=1 Tax=Anaerosalibacter bizertensis TaxID=932217 RepID=A0A9Q4FKK8_9FIRM|nr:ATP-dependent protease ATPase subunit HslU [Anaerosalibacter bizertensis]MBV1816561.1 ATP-dependent protease ATPase subunit HslU [Bacteroidales bacterium MSK.15.36]MBU5293307.1 ATP-dependent protease ATPase subunit HslU [Anaerosalibacter bizertensis]MCB5558635.1 ATP-dependent protease ATPase subunit HslU [Anaerosalibacter bizertensis]MCG4563948.1 ATP-dependent protease ATPase subunit HslU [Anaerosalibacter bizertensis]MCG4581927.1 ATP-dependent protease ATPase subunit HslU [Anaerosalibacter
MMELTPSEIVAELDKYIVGQNKAKRAVAIAIRNRYRRSLLDEEFKDEVKPKNILMVGPTGVGKTEIARRLAKLVKSPFIKVEATKFTEVGYVGRDVDSMVRDLIEDSIRMIKEEKINKVYDKGKLLAEDKILNILVPTVKKKGSNNPLEMFFGNEEEEEETDDNLIEIRDRRDEIKKRLRNGELENRIIEIEVEENLNSTVEYFSGLGMEEFNINVGDMFGEFLPKKTKKRKVTIKEARKIIAAQEAQKLIDMDEVTEEGIKRAENSGIIFIDEIDKIAGKEYSSGPDVSREGVQRDILPIIEGSTIMTKYGPVKTDHILFIAAGAFHVSKISDLIPEIQGRFPIRVELDNLTEENFKEILTKPKNALIKQYELLLKTEGINLKFSEEAISEIAKFAYIFNEQYENIGARRLHTVIEKVLEDVSFNGPDLEEKDVILNGEYIKTKLMNDIQQKDISKYIL